MGLVRGAGRAHYPSPFPEGKEMTFPSYRGGCVAAVTVALSTLALMSTAPAHARASERTTLLLSRAADGGFPNGGSRNPAVSHDQRIARVMAYESDASNIVSGDVNNTADVFIVRRQGPWGQHGTAWSMGGTELASKSIGGAPANGPSTQPALDGDSHHAPSCVAFVSAASNLVPGDTNGRPDVFVRSLASGAITRASVDSHGAQGNGASYDVSVDGDCEQVAFTSDSTNLGGGSGHKQVYVHFLHANPGGPSSRAPARPSCSRHWPRTWPAMTPTTSRTSTSGR
jgi:hypothetical protein